MKAFFSPKIPAKGNYPSQPREFSSFFMACRPGPAMLFYLLLTFLFTLLPAIAQTEENSEFIAIAYHDVVKTKAELASDAVTVDHLIDQFEWLLANNYHPISIDDLLAAKSGKKPLPKKAVLLCWDDGYTSFYTTVFPLLRAYNFPAVLALEGSWIEPGPGEMVRYGRTTVPRSKFLTWPQLQQLADSPLVEIASHSYDLHHGIRADEYGDKIPAVIAHRYNQKTHSYETDQEQYQRIVTDLKKNSALLQKRLGKRPRVMVWPFGLYTEPALKAAAEAGMKITLTLDPVPATTNNLREIGRIYPTLNPDLTDFRAYLDPAIAPPIRHFFKVSSKDLLDPRPGTEQRFSRLLDRLKSLTPSMIAFSPLAQSGGGIQALFPNTVFPLAQDRLARLTWHAAHRGGTSTFLWLPPLLFSSDEEQQKVPPDFFAQMGKFAFCEGIIVNAPTLTREFLRLSSTRKAVDPAIRSWNPARRKMFRQRLLKTSHAPGLINALKKIEAFQKWQPFIEVALVIPLDRLPELTVEKTKFLLQYFDFLLVDGRTSNNHDIKKMLKNNLGRLHASRLLAKISLFVKRKDDTDNIQRLFTNLPRYNIINWGYDYDDFLNNRPTTISIRPLISKSSDPFQ